MSLNNKFQNLLDDLHSAQSDNDKNKEIEAYLKLSEYHYNNSDFQKAKISLYEILKINKNQTNVNYYLALIYINLNDYDTAMIYLEKEIKINPNNIHAKKLIDKLRIQTNIPVITLVLLVLNALCFIFIYPKILFVDALRFGVSSANINIFNAFISIFFHINIYHFLFNMIALIALGLILEKHIGSIRFLIIYLISGMVGNVMESFFVLDSIVLGASAAIFGILGALMMREPLLKVRLFFIFKIPIILVLGGVFILHSIMNYYLNEILLTAMIAHYTGLFVGILLIGIFYNESINIYYNWLFIVLGFGFIEYGIKNLILSGFNSVLYILIFSTLIVIGIIIIDYSYFKLKKYEKIRGEFE